MNRPDAEKLRRISDLVQLKSDRAMADLASASARCAEIRDGIETLRETARLATSGADDMRSARLAVAYARMIYHKQAGLFADLAQAELHRREALTEAQRQEGRRIALSRLRDQTS